MKWVDFENHFLPLLVEVHARKGSLADAPVCFLEDGDEDSLDPIHQAVDAALVEWQSTGQLPPLPSAANRLLELRLFSMLGLCHALDEAEFPLPYGWTNEHTLEWLAWNVFDATARQAVNAALSDVLKSGEAEP